MGGNSSKTVTYTPCSPTVNNTSKAPCSPSTTNSSHSSDNTKSTKNPAVSTTSVKMFSLTRTERLKEAIYFTKCLGSG